MAEEEKVAPVTEFENADKRSKIVPLDWPFTLNGERWTAVTIGRVTGQEVDDYMDALSRGEKVIPPMFAFPIEVYNGMDDDDRHRIDEAVIPFLPRRLRAAAEQAPAALEPTSAS